MDINKIIDNNKYDNINDIEKNIDDDLNNLLKIKKNKKIDTIVLSGGGSRGFSYTGVFKALEELNILKDINTFVGTSMGAIACFFLICGYTADEIMDFCLIFDFNKLSGNFDKNLLFDLGLDDGNKFCKLFETLLEDKNFKKDLTFKELYDSTKKKLIINGTCLNNNEVYFFDVDSYPDMTIVKAIRISISLPFLFTPVLHDDLLFIDGGVMNNYLIDLFNDKLDSVFGVLTSFNNDEIYKVTNLEEYLSCFYKCYSKACYDTIYTAYKKYTLLLNFDIDVSEFLKKDKKSIFNAKLSELYNIGYEKTIDYFKSTRNDKLINYNNNI